MNKAIIHFVISAIVGLGLGYLAFDVIASDKESDTEVSKASEETVEKVETTETASASEGNNILQTKGCIGCHAVEGLNLQGGATGPDLTQAYNNVEGKHGKPLDDFLKEPTSAVMSSVISGSPLTDEEINKIVEELKKAASN